ncbi:glycosyltransferase family 4 protein [Methanofollis ethanolicus]|uniref:glycosyltransferase family 4 protein n=1 Tax=Methanofollis ethanolicus TaxID=488124 RepID=UPI00082E0F16|nr:glycosyltransferase family 4 protein [Methanofollis ethanolicus]
MPQYTAEIANAVAENADVTVVGSNNIPADYFSKKITIIKLFDHLDFSMNHLRKVISFQNLFALISFRRIKTIGKIDPDIIHITTPLIPPLAFFLFINRIDRKYPIVYTKHGLYSNSGLFKKIFEEYVLNFSEQFLSFKKIIVHTLNDREELLAARHLEKKNVVVIPHGTYDFFTHYKKEIPEEKDTVLFFGNIREYKGLDILLSAVPTIVKQIPSLKVIIAGEGDLSPYHSLMEVCDRSTLEVHNEFIPDDLVASLFQRSALVVLPYTEMSGMSGVLNVAYAFGKPVIVSDVGGLDEAVEHGKTGLLVPPGDPLALADAIIRLLADPNLRTMMETNVRKKAEELSWESVAKKTMRIYREVSIRIT